jgi:hypothetical protein
LFNRRQEEITTEREEIDRQKKMLLKKRPSNSETARKRSSTQQQQQQGQGSAILHNGTDATFLKPDAIPGFSWQEYYEADEILKVSIAFPSFCLMIGRSTEGIRSLNILPNGCIMASDLHRKGEGGGKIVC